ncbi:MAG: hypothetical protein PHV34_09645 [Verrucomicrobiae bacterium]|nr:hypothetical protein [Verrucomicrobiae bacterium]
MTPARRLLAWESPFFWLLAMIFLMGLFFMPWWAGWTYFWGDAVFSDWPIQSIFAEHYACGSIPLWDPYSYGGDAWPGSPVRGIFYPGFILPVIWLFLSGAATLSASAYACYLIFHYFLAAHGVWFLLGRQAFAPSWRCMGALAYALAIHTLGRFSVINYLIALAWFPWLIWALIRFCEQPSWRRSGVFGLLLGTTFLGTAPQHVFFITAGLCLFVLFERIKHPGTPVGDFLKKLAVGWLVGLGLALAPMLYHYEFACFNGRLIQSFRLIDDGASPWWVLARAFYPGLTGYYFPGGLWESWGDARPWPYAPFFEETIYPGLTLWLGFFLALSLGCWRRRTVWPWMALFIFGLLWSFGGFNPLRILVRWIIQPLATARIPIRCWFLVQLGLVIIALYGFKALLQAENPGHRAWRAFFSLVTVHAISLAVAVWRFVTVPPLNNPSLALHLSILTIAWQGIVLALLYLWIRMAVLKRVSFACLSAGLLIPLALEIVPLGIRIIGHPGDPEDYYVQPGHLRAIKTTLDRNLQRLDQPEISLRFARWKIPSMQGNSNMAPPNSGSGFIGEFKPGRIEKNRRLDLYGVRFRIVWDGYRQFIRERSTAFPKAWFCPRAVTAGWSECLEMIDDPRVDLRQTVLLVQTTDSISLPPAPPSNPPGDGKVRVVRYQENEIILQSSSSVPGWVVINDHDIPGWNATVNGKPAVIFKADCLFRAVHVPAGRHEIRCWFWPENLTRGLIIGALSLLAGLAMIFQAPSRLRMAGEKFLRGTSREDLDEMIGAGGQRGGHGVGKGIQASFVLEGGCKFK